jgi:hypothetical protein
MTDPDANIWNIEVNVRRKDMASLKDTKLKWKFPLSIVAITTGIELSNQLDGTFTSSGGGALESTPEPQSLVLLGRGLASLLAYRKRARLFQ